MKTIVKMCVAAAAVTLVAAGCGSDDSDSDSGTTTVTVFAAASLKTTFTELGEKFEAAHPDTKVEFSFAGSSDLAAQLIDGADADVFASADTNNMTKVTDAGLAAAPVDFASNTLTIVTAPGNPKNIDSFADLAEPGLQVVVCAPQVPCGTATGKVETATGVDVAPVSEESSVTDVLNKVTSGQADAGVVYVTDAATAGDKVTEVRFPEAAEAVNTYPLVVLDEAPEKDLGAQFLALVTGQEGQAVLAEAGFGAP